MLFEADQLVRLGLMTRYVCSLFYHHRISRLYSLLSYSNMNTHQCLSHVCHTLCIAFAIACVIAVISMGFKLAFRFHSIPQGRQFNIINLTYNAIHFQQQSNSSSKICFHFRWKKERQKRMQCKSFYQFITLCCYTLHINLL